MAESDENGRNFLVQIYIFINNLFDFPFKNICLKIVEETICIKVGLEILVRKKVRKF